MRIKRNIQYPEHLSDPLRKQIATQYIQHELRKLFPSLKSPEEWGKIDADVNNWFSGNILMTPVRNFWNGFHAISRGFRYKNLLPTLTSKNVIWQERVFSLTELNFGATFEGIEFIGKNPSVVEVQSTLSKPENVKIREKLILTLKTKADYSASRESDKLIVNRVDGVLRVVDGNRRMFLALWSGKKELQCYFGEPIGQPEIFEHWVPAVFLQDLLFLHSSQASQTPEFTAVIAKVIATSLKNSSSGRMEWEEICLNATNPLDAIVHEQVNKLL